MDNKAQVGLLPKLVMVVIVIFLLIILLTQVYNPFADILSADCEEKGFVCALDSYVCDSDETLKERSCDPQKWEVLVDKDYKEYYKLYVDHERFKDELIKGENLNPEQRAENVLTIARALCPIKGTSIQPKKTCQCCIKALGLLK